MRSLQLNTIRLADSSNGSVDEQACVKCFDQILFKDQESGKRIWEAGIVMARFMHHQFVRSSLQDF